MDGTRTNHPFHVRLLLRPCLLTRLALHSFIIYSQWSWFFIYYHLRCLPRRSRRVKMKRNDRNWWWICGGEPFDSSCPCKWTPLQERTIHFNFITFSWLFRAFCLPLSELLLLLVVVYYYNTLMLMFLPRPQSVIWFIPHIRRSTPVFRQSTTSHPLVASDWDFGQEEENDGYLAFDIVVVLGGWWGELAEIGVRRRKKQPATHL